MKPVEGFFLPLFAERFTLVAGCLVDTGGTYGEAAYLATSLAGRGGGLRPECPCVEGSLTSCAELAPLVCVTISATLGVRHDKDDAAPFDDQGDERCPVEE